MPRVFHGQQHAAQPPASLTFLLIFGRFCSVFLPHLHGPSYAFIAPIALIHLPTNTLPFPLLLMVLVHSVPQIVARQIGKISEYDSEQGDIGAEGQVSGSTIPNASGSAPPGSDGSQQQLQQHQAPQAEQELYSQARGQSDGGASARVPLPLTPANDIEALWLSVIQNPQDWWDNRQVRGTRLWAWVLEMARGVVFVVGWGARGAGVLVCGGCFQGSLPMQRGPVCRRNLDLRPCMAANAATSLPVPDVQ